MTLHLKWLLLSAASLVLACSPEAGTASNNAATAAVEPEPAAIAASDPAAAMAAPALGATGKIAVSGAAGADALAQTTAAATRQRLTKIKVTASQSFGLTVDGQRVAAIVTGEANLAGGTPGCFAAIVQSGRVSLVPTIGQENYEAESCNKATAVGILTSSGDAVRIGVMFAAYSPNAEVNEPVVLSWVRSTGALSIDKAASDKASLAGAQSIAAMRRAIQ